MMAYAKDALLGFAALIFLFFTTRSLRKRESETIDEPVWLRELEAPMRLSELERETAVRPAPAPAGVGAGAQRAEVGAGGEGGDPLRRQVEALADSDPELVAQQLRTWMQEG
jgi:flagellar M-ring protein FliF